METEFTITASSVLTMGLDKKMNNKPYIKLVDADLHPGMNLVKEKYLHSDNTPTQEGSLALTLCFVHGLIANIHYAKEHGYRDDAEHLRYIISELERAFIEPGIVIKK